MADNKTLAEKVGGFIADTDIPGDDAIAKLARSPEAGVAALAAHWKAGDVALRKGDFGTATTDGLKVVGDFLKIGAEPEMAAIAALGAKLGIGGEDAVAPAAMATPAVPDIGATVIKK